MSESDVLTRADAWQQTIEARDVDAVADFLHEDFALVLVHPAAVTVPRAEWLRSLADYVVHSYVIHSRTVSVAADVAMVLQSADQQATVSGSDRSGLFIVSDCWLRSPDGVWRVWRRHSTPLHAGVMPRSDAG